MLLAAATAGEMEGALEEVDDAVACAAGLRIPDDDDDDEAPVAVAAAAAGAIVARLLAAAVVVTVAMLGWRCVEQRSGTIFARGVARVCELDRVDACTKLDECSHNGMAPLSCSNGSFLSATGAGECAHVA